MQAQHKLLITGLIAASLALPLTAQARVYVDVNVAPPAPVGYVWAPGYWAWDSGHHHHVWRKGHYIHERHGERWVADQWHEHEGRYRYEPGRWER